MVLQLQTGKMADKLDSSEQRELVHDDLEKQFQEVRIPARTSALGVLTSVLTLAYGLQVLTGLAADAELAPFKAEYQKVYGALVQVCAV